MNEQKKKLWKALSDAGYYTKTFEDFEKKYSTPESIGQLHTALYDGGYYTKTSDDFFKQYFEDVSRQQQVTEIKKKSEVGSQLPSQSESTSEGNFLGEFIPEEFKGREEEWKSGSQGGGMEFPTPQELAGNTFASESTTPQRQLTQEEANIRIQEDAEKIQKDKEIRQQVDEGLPTFTERLMNPGDAKTIDEYNSYLSDKASQVTSQLEEYYTTELEPLQQQLLSEGKTPEEISNILWGKINDKSKELMKPQTSFISPEEEKRLTEVFESAYFKGLDIDSQQNFLSKYIRQLTNDPVEQAQAENEFYYKFFDKLYTNKNTGNMSEFALRNEAENLLSEVEAKLEITQKLVDDQNSWAYTTGINQHGQSFKQLLPSIQQQYDNLRNAKGNLERMLEAPEANQTDWKSFTAGLNSGKLLEKMPFIGSIASINKNMYEYSVLQKKANGEALSKWEEVMLKAMALKNKFEGDYSNNTWYNIGKGVSENLAFLPEFAVTAGTQSVVKKGVQEALEATTKKLLKRELNKTTQRLISNPIEAIITALAATASSPQMYLENFSNRIKPNVQLALSEDGDKLSADVDSAGENWDEAFLKAVGTTWAEFLTEKALKINPYIKDVIGKNPEWLKRFSLAFYMNKMGITSKEGFQKLLADKLGWNGILEEIGEEIKNIPLQNLITGDYEDTVLDGILKPGTTELDIQNLKEIAGVTAIIGGPGTIATFARKKDGSTTINLTGSKESVFDISDKQLSILEEYENATSERKAEIRTEIQEFNSPDAIELGNAIVDGIDKKEKGEISQEEEQVLTDTTENLFNITDQESFPIGNTTEETPSGMQPIDKKPSDAIVSEAIEEEMQKPEPIETTSEAETEIPVIETEITQQTEVEKEKKSAPFEPVGTQNVFTRIETENTTADEATKKQAQAELQKIKDKTPITFEAAQHIERNFDKIEQELIDSGEIQKTGENSYTIENGEEPVTLNSKSDLKNFLLTNYNQYSDQIGVPQKYRQQEQKFPGTFAVISNEYVSGDVVTNVIKFFAKGGKVSAESIKNQTGAKKLNTRQKGLTSKSGKSIEQIAEEIATETISGQIGQEGESQVDDKEIRDAIIDYLHSIDESTPTPKQQLKQQAYNQWAAENRIQEIETSDEISFGQELGKEQTDVFATESEGIAEKATIQQKQLEKEASEGKAPGQTSEDLLRQTENKNITEKRAISDRINQAKNLPPDFNDAVRLDLHYNPQNLTASLDVAEKLVMELGPQEAIVFVETNPNLGAIKTFVYGFASRWYREQGEYAKAGAVNQILATSMTDMGRQIAAAGMLAVVDPMVYADYVKELLARQTDQAITKELAAALKNAKERFKRNKKEAIQAATDKLFDEKIGIEEEKEIPKRKPSKTKKESIREKRKSLLEQLKQNSQNRNFGIVYDPKAEGERMAEMHKLIVKIGLTYVEEGVVNAKEFIRKLKVALNKVDIDISDQDARRLWDDNFAEIANEAKKRKRQADYNFNIWDKEKQEAAKKLSDKINQDKKGKRTPTIIEDFANEITKQLSQIFNTDEASKIKSEAKTNLDVLINLLANPEKYDDVLSSAVKNLPSDKAQQIIDIYGSGVIFEKLARKSYEEILKKNGITKQTFDEIIRLRTEEVEGNIVSFQMGLKADLIGKGLFEQDAAKISEEFASYYEEDMEKRRQNILKGLLPRVTSKKQKPEWERLYEYIRFGALDSPNLNARIANAVGYPNSFNPQVSSIINQTAQTMANMTPTGRQQYAMNHMTPFFAWTQMQAQNATFGGKIRAAGNIMVAQFYGHLFSALSTFSNARVGNFILSMADIGFTYLSNPRKSKLITQMIFSKPIINGQKKGSVAAGMTMMYGLSRPGSLNPNLGVAELYGRYGNSKFSRGWGKYIRLSGRTLSAIDEMTSMPKRKLFFAIEIYDQIARNLKEQGLPVDRKILSQQVFELMGYDNWQNANANAEIDIQAQYGKGWTYQGATRKQKAEYFNYTVSHKEQEWIDGIGDINLTYGSQVIDEAEAKEIKKLVEVQAGRLALMGQPSGTFGIISSWLATPGKYIPTSKILFGTIINAPLNFVRELIVTGTPGANILYASFLAFNKGRGVASTIGASKLMEEQGIQTQLTEAEVRKQMAKTGVVTGVQIGLFFLFGLDDDTDEMIEDLQNIHSGTSFDIVGLISDDYTKREEIKKSYNIQEKTIYVGGYGISYKNTWLEVPLASIAAWKDHRRFTSAGNEKFSESSVNEIMNVSIAGMLMALTDAALLKNITNLADAMSGRGKYKSTDETELQFGTRLTKWFKDQTASSIATLVRPRIMMEGYNIYETAAGGDQKQPHTYFDKIISYTPIFASMLDAKQDIFGRDLPQRFKLGAPIDAKSTIDYVVGLDIQDEYFELLQAKGRTFPLIPRQEKISGTFTKQEYEKYWEKFAGSSDIDFEFLDTHVNPAKLDDTKEYVSFTSLIDGKEVYELNKERGKLYKSIFDEGNNMDILREIENPEMFNTVVSTLYNIAGAATKAKQYNVPIPDSFAKKEEGVYQKKLGQLTLTKNGLLLPGKTLISIPSSIMDIISRRN